MDLVKNIYIMLSVVSMLIYATSAGAQSVQALEMQSTTGSQTYLVSRNNDNGSKSLSPEERVWYAAHNMSVLEQKMPGQGLYLLQKSGGLKREAAVEVLRYADSSFASHMSRDHQEIGVICNRRNSLMADSAVAAQAFDHYQAELATTRRQQGAELSHVIGAEAYESLLNWVMSSKPPHIVEIDYARWFKSSATRHAEVITKICARHDAASKGVNQGDAK